MQWGTQYAVDMQYTLGAKRSNPHSGVHSKQYVSSTQKVLVHKGQLTQWT